MASHCGPLLYTLDVVKHHPPILKITFKLHMLHQVQSTSRSFGEHFEDVHLLFLAREDTIVFVFKLSFLLYSHDVVNNPSSIILIKW